ncbi:MAG: glycoside hydrolase family 16 protein [Chitinophagales bacterium]|nr:glycoside hydrolase family 16 protein [Chitinophagales bacterium]
MSACKTDQKEEVETKVEEPLPVIVTVNPMSMNGQPGITTETGSVIAFPAGEGFVNFEVEIPEAGRYRSFVKYSKIEQSGENAGEGYFWIEDYVDNTDDRTYNITGKMMIPKDAKSEVFKDGSPLNKGLHKMKLHYNGGMIEVHEVRFKLMRRHIASPEILTQNVEGEEWEVVWSDEFDGSGIPDTTKWTFDIGNWGWGNNEVQYYTANRKENARMENGNLVIEARKNDMGHEWTSTRLTTRGKVGFIYGKIEFRAKVPSKKGTWAAGWTLGNEYVDEISWPYCGEIDILESVGFETDDETGDGIAHATVHSGAYYFKKGNHFTGDIPVEDIANEFQVYSVEWTPSEIKAFVNGNHYYTYDKTANELEWPFNKAQNIILNLTLGGGWGGEIDESITSQKYIIDYVRVYGRK